MTAKEYTIMILKNKRKDSKHKKAEDPQVSENKGINDEYGKFFQIAAFIDKDDNTFHDGKYEAFNVFDTGIRPIVFKKISQKLTDPNNWRKEGDDVIFKQEALIARGIPVSEKCENHYLWDYTKNQALTRKDGSKIERDFVRVFIFDFEFDAENGGNSMIDSILSAEISRAEQHLVPKKSNPGGPSVALTDIEQA